MLSVDRLRKGLRNPGLAADYAASRLGPTFSAVELPIASRFPRGQNVLDEDWDVLLILDTCRVDALREAAERTDYEWLTEIGSRLSVGGSTLEWTAQTFREAYRDQAKVDYIAGNVLVQQVLSGGRTPEEIADVPWAPTAWETLPESALNHFLSAGNLRASRQAAAGHQDRPHPSADLVTDLAIDHAREVSPERMIVHYVQPHYPYYSAIESGEQEELTDWQRYPFWELRTGEVNRERVWNRYMDELLQAIEAIDTLLENLDAERVAITADHGEAFGERHRGMRGFGHRAGTSHPSVRRVPWTTTTATDHQTYNPEVDTVTNNQDTEEQLSALGYI
jgi:hypothetical protein